MLGCWDLVSLDVLSSYVGTKYFTIVVQNCTILCYAVLKQQHMLLWHGSRSASTCYDPRDPV